MPLQYCKYHFSSQNILSYSVNNTPQTPQTLKTEERMQVWDRKLHRLKILPSSCPVRYVPCWGEGQTSALSTKTKAATMTSIKTPSFSFKKTTAGYKGWTPFQKLNWETNHFQNAVHIREQCLRTNLGSNPCKSRDWNQWLGRAFLIVLTPALF